MNIETAKELKALQKGYTSWQWLVDTYIRCGAVDYIEIYLGQDRGWVENGISVDEMAIIEIRIKDYGSKYADEIRERLEVT